MSTEKPSPTPPAHDEDLSHLPIDDPKRQKPSRPKPDQDLPGQGQRPTVGDRDRDDDRPSSHAPKK